ncbi:hypothetical protein JOF53_006929 [Crossiella equi]|uniref:Uncharacterized protein n=1 Tax=Crossiella equi TaxID=130796 RepID=A0ABS5ANB6_9PSEU|nr:hypothetical protein [Crossiella equi]MBP2478057.1 hypothetical protein [Crossiella equi]
MTGDIGEIGDVGGTVITAPSGPTQTGDGQQIFAEISAATVEQHFTQVTVHGLLTTGDGHELRRRWLSAELLGWLRERFVEPRGFGEVVTRLAQHHVVFVAGADGSGRRTAAVLALTGRAEVRVRELSAGTERLFDPDGFEAGERVLLDLSTVDPPAVAEADQLLRTLVSRARELGCRLAVVLPEGGAAVLDTWLARSVAVVALTGEQRHRLLARHLPEVGPAELADERLRPVLHHPARELSRLADLVLAAQRRTRGFAAALELALAAYRDYAEELAKEFRDHPEPRWRALVLAAALLEGARPEAVHHACEQLLANTGPLVDEPHRLAGRALGDRLAEVGADVRHDRVTFTRLAYGHAVLGHVWREHPGLRPELTRWVERVPRLPRTRLGAADRLRLAERFTELALATGEDADLRVLSRLWAESSDPRVVPLALTVLRLAVFDPGAGARFRQMLYDWSTRTTSPPNLARVLIATCLQVLREPYPELAVVRLQNLVAHQDPEVVAEAVRALAELAVDTGTRLSLLTRVVKALANGHAVAGNTLAFTALTAPPALFDGAGALWAVPGVPGLLCEGWLGLFRQGPTEEVEVAVRAWLRLVEEPSVDEHWVVDKLRLLVRACAGEVRYQAVLRRVTVGWTEDPDEEVDVAQREWVLGVIDGLIEYAMEEQDDD